MPAYIHSDRGSSFMSAEMKSFLHARGVASSRSTPYNPQGNGQVERYNGIVWKSVTLALRSCNLPVERWEEVLPDALHSIRSLLSTATNETPHERMFRHQRRSSSGTSVPTWLSKPGDLVLMRRHVRQKHDPMVDEVELLEVNPQYAHVRLPDGRETTVSLRHLAPRGTAPTEHSDTDNEADAHKQIPAPTPELPTVHETLPTPPLEPVPEPENADPEPVRTLSDSGPSTEPLRRSTRVVRKPAHLMRDYVL